MPELKPCPFCGSKAQTDNTFLHQTVPGVECTVCGAIMISYLDDMEDAIKAWNRRAEDGK